MLQLEILICKLFSIDAATWVVQNENNTLVHSCSTNWMKQYRHYTLNDDAMVLTKMKTNCKTEMCASQTEHCSRYFTLSEQDKHDQG